LRPGQIRVAQLHGFFFTLTCGFCVRVADPDARQIHCQFFQQIQTVQLRLNLFTSAVLLRTLGLAAASFFASARVASLSRLPTPAWGH
jgi:hypothetical protein